MNDPKFDKTSLVKIERNVKSSVNYDPDMWGPMK